MPNHDYYKTLGVSKSASADEIRKAYKKLSKKYHPDANKEKDAPEQFKQVQEAYDVLQDPEKRQQYDRFGHVLPGGAGAHGQPFQWAGPGPGGAGPIDLGDLFGGGQVDLEQIFGGSFGSAGGRRRTRRGARGGDEYEVAVENPLPIRIGGGDDELNHHCRGDPRTAVGLRGPEVPA